MVCGELVRVYRNREDVLVVYGHGPEGLYKPRPMMCDGSRQPAENVHLDTKERTYAKDQV